MYDSPHFKKHLYFEGRPESKEYKLDRCMKVLEMIAVIKDRINRDEIRLNSTKDDQTFIFYGRDYYGKKIAFDKKVLSRLQQYYNYRLSLVTKY